MRLPENLREKLKEPLGKLVSEQESSKEKILSNIPQNSYVITVGDATTEKLIGFGLNPPLQIVDAQEKRSKRELPSSEQVKTHLDCDNPAGEITKHSIEQIKKAFTMEPPVRITVNGEEDLLVIPVCIFAPQNSVVLYGQPNEGLVIVHITDEIRNKAQSIFNSMN